MKSLLCHWIFAWSLIVEFVACQPLDAYPIYAIGHMANSLRDVARFLREGANGIEADVTFDEDGRPRHTYHGFPCDCWRFCFWKENFSNYLDNIQLMLSSGRTFNFALLYLDLKVSRLSKKALKNAGQLLAIDLLVHLLYFPDFSEALSPWIILGIPDTLHVDLLTSFQNTLTDGGFGHLLKRIGYDVYGSHQDAPSILDSLNLANITDHIWLGAGVTNCLPHFYYRLQKLVTFRDVACSTMNAVHADGVYYWTIDSERHIRGSLRRGVDGIVTNTPGTVVRVLRDEEFRGKFRLATIEDNPWHCKL